jgi:SAM-dependent methyltransferase
VVSGLKVAGSKAFAMCRACHHSPLSTNEANHGKDADMFRKVLPSGVRSQLGTEFRRLLSASLPEVLPEAAEQYLTDLVEKSVAAAVNQAIHTHLPGLLRQAFLTPVHELLPARDGYFHHKPGLYQTQLDDPEPCPGDEALGLPIPPQELWAGYGSTTDYYLEGGKLDVQNMSAILHRASGDLREAGRILEFGCAAGRMLRWLHPLTRAAANGPPCEVWGVDITVEHMQWCKQYLSPPFHFATITLQPHLPFEDRYFGFIYAGSVFTHIADLEDAWFQELRRVLRPGGSLYVTIHDKHTIEILRRESWHGLAGYLRSLPDWDQVSQANFNVLTVAGNDWARRFTFHDVDFLCEQLKPFYRTLSVTPEAYGYQTALLLERR